MFFNQVLSPQGEIALNDQLVQYHVRVSARRKRFAIEIHPDGRVVVCVPAGYKEWCIQQRLIDSADWIVKKLAQFQNQTVAKPSYQYCDGEPHFYLGTRYPIQFETAARARAMLQETSILLLVPNQDPTIVKRTLYSWYQKQALIIFAEVLDICFESFKHYAHPKPAFRVRFMRTQWGSMSPRNVMTLNTHLVRMPRALIEYVIMHELCHLEYRNHGVRFYGLLNQVLPDWPERETQLKAFGL